MTVVEERPPVHPALLSVATIWIAGLFGVLLVLAFVTRSAYALDAALVVALLAFVGTVAAARYYSRGSLFR